MTYARIENGVVAELFTPPENVAIADCFAPGLEWVDVTDVVPAPQVGWTYDGNAFGAPVVVAPPSVVRYVPVYLARERLEAAGKWDALVNALADDQPALIKLLTLQLGLNPADAQVRGVLTAIGADPDSILAP